MSTETSQLMTFSTSEQCAEALAVSVAQKLKQGIEQHCSASLIVSGGSTPLPLFSALSRQTLDWSKVTVTLADERWVPPTHKDSNEALVRKHLLVGNAKEASFCSLYRQQPKPDSAVGEVTIDLMQLPRPFDVVVLGMGNDGHTASLFPCATELRQGLTTQEMCLALYPENGPYPRLSLSLSALLNSKSICLLLTGASKKRVLEEAMSSDNPLEMPVRAVLQQQHVPVDIFWSES